TTEVEGRRAVRALVFLDDGIDRHFLSGGDDGMIREWRVEDGVEVQAQRLTAGSSVQALSLSGDRKCIVSAGERVAIVWNRSSRQSTRMAEEHTDWVDTVDVSPDSTKFATGSRDRRAFIWDISTGRRLIGPLQHNNWVVGVRFAPDGLRIATATWGTELRIYNTDNGQLLRTISMRLCSTIPIAWSSDSQRIFAISYNDLMQVHVDTGTSLSQWSVPGATAGNYMSIALPSNGRFIASFVGPSLSLWDTSTRAQLGPVFDHGSRLNGIALSSDNNYLITGTENGIITIRNLNDIIPLSYLVGRSVVQPSRCMIDFRPQVEALRGVLRALEAHSGGTTTQPIQAQIIPLRISNSTYRIKSTIGDVYLTRPQNALGAVVVQQLEQSSASQRWDIDIRVSDGVYNITGNSNMLLTVGIRNALVTGRRGTAWTFDPRGDAYVIGNAVNATAIQLAPNRRSVS
ncbi:WD40-repeat-containing domain protein, partial [Boletus edulis]